MTKNKCIPVATISLCLIAWTWGAFGQSASAKYWPEAPIKTPWGEKVTPENAWAEYPRPNLVRGNWVNLNGLWDYAVTEKYQGLPDAWAGQILVPFAIESTLGGVRRRVWATDLLWYRRTFECPALEPGERLLLNFEGVDFRSQVWVNGIEVTDVPHNSGLLAFALDITEAVKPGENELVVCAWDPSQAGDQAVGKQSTSPGGISYSATSGIWQPVWLERVPSAYVESYRAVSDIDAGTVAVTVRPGGELMGASAQVDVMLDGQVLASGAVVEWLKPVVLKIPNPRLWSPETPHLYDLRITLKGKQSTDVVKGYFGMRKIEVRADEKGVARFYVNNRKVFMQGTLDQGWWPESLLTPPSDEAMTFDIEFHKRIGFNTMRKHLKIEPRRYYYLCDKLGLFVWQDMVSGWGKELAPWSREGKGRDNEDRYHLFREELKGMMDQLQNFPSIVMWVPYNERWGQPGKAKSNMVIEWMLRYDPTRLTGSASGGNDFGVGDTIDKHLYPGPTMLDVTSNRASVLGEFGGLGLLVEGHTYRSSTHYKTHGFNWETRKWGRVEDTDPAKILGYYANLIDRVAQLASFGLAASIYTQTTDVEDELNGYLTYDRNVSKFDEAALKRLHQKVYDAAVHTKDVVYEPVFPSSKGDAAQRWKYTVEEPSDDWLMLDFDDRFWASGEAGFGNAEMMKDKAAKVRTDWSVTNMWLRREFEIDQLPALMQYEVFYKGTVEIHVNGVLVDTLKTWASGYGKRPVDINVMGMVLKPGRNVLAVKLTNTEGAAYFDLGLLKAVGR